MSLVIMLIPTEDQVGMTSVSLGIIRAMESKGIYSNLFKPIEQPHNSKNISDQATAMFSKYSQFSVSIVEPLKMDYVESMLACNQKNVLMEEIVANYHKNNTKDAEVVVIEGLIPTYKHQFTYFMNYEIAKTLNAKIIFIISQDTHSPEQIKKRINLICSSFNVKNSSIAGVIFDELRAPINKTNRTFLNIPEIFNNGPKEKTINIDLIKTTKYIPFPILGIIPKNLDLITVRVIDIARYLNASMINERNIHTCRVNSVIFCMQNISYMKENFHTDSLLVISSNHPDTLVTACLIATDNAKISAILLTDGRHKDMYIRQLCERACKTELPIFMVDTNIFQTALYLKNFDLEIPIDDYEHIEKILEYISNHININQIKSMTAIFRSSHFYLSPSAFRYQLTELARKADKRVVLPEGNEPRIMKAASICAKRCIATCILLGDPNDINRVAVSHGIELGRGIEIIDPRAIREKYINRLVDLRRDKGMTEMSAYERLKDNTVLGTLMLEKGEVDGLISGAIHTTAHTIRPSLQLIRTMPGSSLVSSIFFMLFPEQVYVYGDCAINPDPTAEQLAEIAIQSADSALAFGIEPFIAMLSYSTGTSGSGVAVEKVLKATFLVKKKRPDLTIDGPLQYDAAVMDDVARSKSPHSSVAGRATVFIFPDLNAGNIAYKAVQRSANIVSIGPMLQGMRKPVNDLSRGALVEDIVYTIALTVIQSIKQN